jgi:L-aminopeptidase/D-esterase-like protein
MQKHHSRREFLSQAAVGALSTGLIDASQVRGQGRERLESNDTKQLMPRTQFDAPGLQFDFPALQIGVAEYAEGPTGCTVFYFPRRAIVAADPRGGSPGTIWTEQLHAGDGWIDAICLAGGSLYGLEAASGVSAELFAMRHYATGWNDIALVTGAIIYDYPPRNNAIYPDKALGRAALRAARTGIFPLGPRGAGCSATVGKWLQPPYQREKAGQGATFRQVGPTKVAVFTVVNAFGAILDRRGEVVRGHLDPRTGKRRRISDVIGFKPVPGTGTTGGNTTLTVVVTNQQLSPRALRHLASQVHDSMARALDPWHSEGDGDTLFAVTTNEVTNPEVNEQVLSWIASESAWDAVLNSFEK